MYKLKLASAVILAFIFTFSTPSGASGHNDGETSSEANPAPAIETVVRKEEALSVFDRIARGGNPGLRIWTNDGQSSYEVGDHLTIHVKAIQPSYVTVIYIDSHGVVTLLMTGDRRRAAFVGPNVDLEIPLKGAGFEIHANLPTGVETLYAVGTPIPIQSSWLIAKDVELFPTLDSDRAVQLAKRLEALLQKRKEFDGYSVARFDQVISLPHTQNATAQYAALGIVEYFTGRHRAVRRPKLDLDIKFRSGTADLTPEAKLDLLEVGKAISDKRLSRNNFVLIGHTDDVGSEDENMALSLRRAASARRFINENFSAESVANCEIAGVGESEPLLPGTSPMDRGLNRRVTLEMRREAMRGNAEEDLSALAITDVEDIDFSAAHVPILDER
ncbi:MAG TPA: DUF4384 domain-containing protein [Myxococcales bacterium]|nr:DUF4384 domain-containing protein [Myxococcales bacterium]HIK84471.1 DUF4384 domain-containing protein [Myxococcales bacterium]